MRSFSDEIVKTSDLKPIKILIGLTSLDICISTIEILNSILHWW